MATPSLTDQVLALPLEERIALAEALWKSINEGLIAISEPEAIEQASRRDVELSTGASPCLTHEEVMRLARQAFR